MRRREILDRVDGALVIDKSEGWTSHDVVAKVRRLANTKKVGHLGTLDPMATGVLPLVLGRATRLAQFFLRNDKVYEGVIRFGFATDTYDREGTPTGPDSSPVIDPTELESAIQRFRGPFEQVPPPVSAKKIAGVPAYKLARKQQPVELKAVSVRVFAFDVLSIDDARDIRVRVHCSSGTYLRSIAHDLGAALGSGAVLWSLRRIASGEFGIERAKTIEKISEMASAERIFDAISPLSELLPEFPAEIVDPVTASQIKQGRDFRVSPFRSRSGQQFVRALSEDGQLIAIGEARMPNVYHPVLVL